MVGSTIRPDLLKHADLKEGTVGKSIRLARESKGVRRRFIGEKNNSHDKQIAAAIEIQRVYRGYCTRCKLLNTVQPKLSKAAVYSASKGEISRLKDVRSPSPVKKKSKIQEKPSAYNRLQDRYGAYVKRMSIAGNTCEETFEGFCAINIQAFWKERKVPPKSHAPIKKKRRVAPLSEVEAAVVVQRAWRRHIDIQVFRYYRDLINFRQRGDPAMMLRCINPNEAKMLDAAAGVHVKFRLAGEKFPPNIYYKVFTHRPVQDLCANSPKDYTQASSKRFMAKDVHNKGSKVQQYGTPTDKRGWYERLENNGWRLVSDRLIHHAMTDSTTYDSAQKKIDFHHNKLQRRDDMEKKKKRKKIQWMQKMYKQGMLRARVDDKDTVELIEGAAAGMVATVDSQGPESVQEWEVDELLDWTTSLNFDDYWMTWKETATSSSSEKRVDQRRCNEIAYAKRDPFELTVNLRTLVNRREGSTRQSHNTPVSGQSVSSAIY